MELILISGTGTFVLLAAQLFAYLWQSPRQPFVGRLPLSPAEDPLHAPANAVDDVATRYDRAA
jgi:hypothetical protein